VRSSASADSVSQWQKRHVLSSTRKNLSKKYTDTDNLTPLKEIFLENLAVAQLVTKSLFCVTQVLLPFDRCPPLYPIPSQINPPQTITQPFFTLVVIWTHNQTEVWWSTRLRFPTKIPYGFLSQSCRLETPVRASSS